jgi:hypothetical protein
MLTACEASDLGGFRFPTKNNNGEMITTASLPEIISLCRDAASDGSRVILFLDERNQAALDVLKAVAPIILDGRAGQFSLPEGSAVISASNRMSDKAGVNRPPMHLLNREVELAIQTNIPALQKYMQGIGIEPLFTAFAGFKPGVVSVESVPSEPVPYCTPRSFVECAKDVQALSQLLNVPSLDVLDSEPTIIECVEGRIGKGAAMELVTFLKVAKDLHSWQTLISTPEQVTIPTGRLDIAHAYLSMILHNAPNVTNDEEMANVFTFITTKLPKEFQVALTKQVSDATGGRVLQNNKFRQFVMENKALIHATMA